MATIENNYVGNGSTVLYSFTFPYLNESDIRITLNGTPTTSYILANATTIQFNTAPGNGVAIRIYRTTDDENLQARFSPGSAIRSQDLNDNFTQNLYVTQEANFNVVKANTTANTALGTANTALSNSNTAINTANAASSSAANAVSTSNAASSSAAAAVSTANTASSNASSAVSTANTASSNAATALSTSTATAAAQSALAANVYDRTELDGGQLDNRYYTETELNNGQLDNRYYTESESDSKYWNKTTQTIDSGEAWSNSNDAIATTAAINARIVDLVNDVGGFVVVNTEESFPNAGIVDAAGSPDSGILVSITDVTGLTWNNSGVSTNARTSNDTTVTITGIPAGSPSSGGGMQVLSTSTLHTYTFVRFIIASSVAQTLSDNLAEILAVDSNAQAAAASASLANDWATKTAGVVAGGEYSSKYHAIQAASSAINASNSASAASTSASNASNSASQAATSASNALTSAASAAGSAALIGTLQYLQDFGLIINAAGSTSDYGVLV